MGKISYAGQYRSGPNAALVDILEKAAAASGYDVEFKSGYRAGDARQHGKKNAIDVTLVDPATGKKVPDYQNGASFRTYEEFAQTARQVQQRDYPELSSKMRWGGYFSGGKGKYGALDLMHFDLAGDKLGMVGGSWDKGLTAAQRKLFPSAVSVGFKNGPVPPLGLTGEAIPVTANARLLDLKRTQFAAQLQNTPLPRPRPDAPAQQTFQPGMMGRGQPIVAGSPTPATMSPALAAARQRLTAAREAKASNGVTTPAAMSVTPRLPENFDQPRSPEELKRIAATAIPMDQSAVQARATLMDEGVGSLLNPHSVSPGALNPGQVAPVVAGRPDAPIGALPAAQAAAPPIPRPRPELASDSATSGAPAKSQPKYATMPNGKQVEIGKLYDIGGTIYTGGVDANGNGTLVKQPKSIFGEAGKDTIVGGAIGNAVGTAVDDAKTKVAEAMPAVTKGVSDAAGGVASSVGNFLGGLFGGKEATKPATGNTLVTGRPPAPVGTFPAAKSANTLTSVTNPAYAEWAAKYGDGSRVQTAPTGGMVSANQLAAIQNVNGAVQKPIAPPAPPKMIQVAKPANTLSSSTSQPSQAPAPAAPKLYQSAGYIYAANPNGTGYTKVGKVGSSSGGNTLSAPSNASSSSSSSGRGITGNKAFADWAFG